MSIDLDPRIGLAAAVAGRAPDTALAARLDQVDPTSLTGEDLAAYVRARWALHNRAEALLLAGLRELGTAQDGHTGRLASSDEFSGDEVAGVLGCSRTAASRRLDLADDLFSRLPALGAALWSGRLDEPKVRAISEGVRDLSTDHAREAVEVVLSEAAGLPVMALRERVGEVALDLDPEWAERRRRRAEGRGRVELVANASGTATLTFADAPAPEGIASMARAEALAARLRTAGVLTPINQLRLQVGMRLLNGSTAGMTDDEVVARLTAEYHATATPTDDDPDSGPDDTGPDGGPDDSGPDDSGPDGGPHDSGPDDTGPDDTGPGGGPGADGPDGAGLPAGDPEMPAPRSPGAQGALDLPDLPDPAGRPDPVGEPEPRDGRLRHGTTEVRLRLTTALGLDQHPGTVPGYGAVTAAVARDLIAARHHGEWRIVLVDADGHLQHVLLARARPAGPLARGRAPGATRTGAIVELQVPTTLLAALNPDDHPRWALLLRELQARVADRAHTGDLGRPPDADSGPDQWRRRRPGAEADRWTRARDRHCVVPWCRRAAHRAEIDHTRDHAHGGPTVTWNLGAWCTHDHRAKHHAGWTVRQPLPGWFVIRTRAGITHTTRAPTILRPLPGPRPARAPRPLPDDGWPDHRPDDEDDWRRRFAAELGGTRATRNDPPPRPPAALDPDGPPPF
ncbi:uncharacterized protein DUF222 [Actinomycetospora succinea]|uniref:Uncharacterized protein DUF222 n=1 Tax=Actinomycetospora succinea TaxID=663603 RepID=A0A4R6VN90_9PSEU|nr:HNH endonuclease signature motif containing protein [Actinomycetospora succinea]TDQ60835.1 uncharacterized protein DUF222 [Actinomycetospora succinea]